MLTPYFKSNLSYYLAALLLAWCSIATSIAKTPALTGDFAHYRTATTFINTMVRKHGFDKSYLSAIFSKAKNHKNTLKQINRPIKNTGVSKGSWNRYTKSRLNQTKINGAKRFIRKHRTALKRAEKIYGVPAQYIVAIIGIETNFGGFVGKTSTLSALSTLAFGKNRRAAYFQKELESFLLMTRNSKRNPLSLKGSYAGAMGLGQFMPSSFTKYMVDFNRDGRKDMWNATDMIGSIAQYFKKNGWRSGSVFAVKARATNQGFTKIDYGWRYRYTLEKLKSLGIKPNKPIHASPYYFIKLRTYKGYDLYIAGHNFYVVTRYNNSSKYSMTVHLLAEKIKRYL